MKTAAIVAFLKMLLAAFSLWQHRKTKAETKEEVQDDIRLVDQAKALRVERVVDTVPRELPDEQKPERRGRRGSKRDY